MSTMIAAAHSTAVTSAIHATVCSAGETNGSVHLDRDAALLGRLVQAGVIALGLVGVGVREVGDCLVEDVVGAEVAGDERGIAGASVGPSQHDTAEGGVALQ